MINLENAIPIAQFVVMGVLIATLVITKNEYKTRMRPYIGFKDIVVKDTDRPDKIIFEVFVRNVGQLPAKNAKLYGKCIVGGKETTPFECETKGSVFPASDLGSKPDWIVGITEVDKDAILNGSKRLDLVLTLDYYGSGRKKFQTSSSRTYDPNRKDWVNEEGSWT